MYSSVRKYRSSDTAELSRLVQESFVPLVKEVEGFGGYYVVAAADGTLVTITVAESEAAVEESVSKARDWVAENAPELVEGAPDVVNGEVTVSASA